MFAFTHAVRKHLLEDLQKFGECLDASWHLKRQFSSLISSQHIDSVYDGATKKWAPAG